MWLTGSSFLWQFYARCSGMTEEAQSHVITSGETLTRIRALLRFVNCLFVLIFVAAGPALAQQEPPSRVGRVSFISGSLAFHMPGENEWSAASINYPIGTGASLWTESDARAEIRIGPNTIALAGSTELDIGRLTEQIMQINIPQGRIYLRVRQLDENNTFELAVPRGGILLLQPGYYDIESGSQDRPARIAVFEGSARFDGNGADTEIKAGDAAVLSGVNPVTASIERAVADAFVEWCRSRDYDEKRLAAPYHVSPNMTGYAELDPHGRWGATAGYGDVWYPNVPTGWAPYTDGRWVWVEPWGWTWIDDAPWGFAPSHYGRWAFVGERWCWVPGSFVQAPVYAPALVGFLGGAGLGLYVSGAAGPQVGWFPLGPGEIYWPSYHAGSSYIRALNSGNVANLDTIRFPRNGALPAQIANAQFANRRFAAVVPEHVFASAGKVSPAALHMPAGALEHAPVTMRSPHVRPVRALELPGPAAFGARGQSGRVSGAVSGYGSPAGPARNSRRAEDILGSAGSHLAAPARSSAAAQGLSIRSAGRWPGRSPPEHYGAAPPQRAQAVHMHSQPMVSPHGSRLPAPGYRAPSHAVQAAPQIAGLRGRIGGGRVGGGGHAPGGGGHSAGDGGHAQGGGRGHGGDGGHHG
jgi:hypothetical protein